MYSFEFNQIIFIITATLFILGVFSFVSGLFILLYRSMSKELHQLSTKTAQLAQKGITDDISGLVGNASALIHALQKMAETAAGIGQFLILNGFVMIAGAFTLSYFFLQ